MAESHRQEILTALLEWYVDVLNGVRDGVGDDAIHLPLMCRAYNSPAYRELERLLPLLAEAEPNLYWNVAERYWRARTRRVLRCPRCMRFEPFTASNSNGHVRVHKHGSKNIQLKPAIVPMLDERVEAERIERGIAWLAENWQGVEPCSRASSSGRSRRGTLSRHGEVAVHALGLACVEALEASAPRQARPTLTAGSKTPRYSRRTRRLLAKRPSEARRQGSTGRGSELNRT